MSTTKKKKTAREKRVLIASLIVAGAIVAGSTFAWFTSKDEVTNRLSASADYNVSIAESFQPPESWVPGQEINKDAAAVNTGNVDAFVRMWLDGDMRLLNQTTTVYNHAMVRTTSGDYTFEVPAQEVTDQDLLNLNLTHIQQDTSGNHYYKTLDKTQTLNPASSVSTDNSGYASGKYGPYSEVQAMQTGILAFAPSDASYSYVLAEETELEIYVTSNESGSLVTGYKKVQVPAGTLVVAGKAFDTTTGSGKAATLDTNGVLTPVSTAVTVTSTSGSTNTYNSTVYIKSQSNTIGGFIPQNIEAESFTPMTKGLYLFLRNEGDVAQTAPEFSGYYMDGAFSDTTGFTNVDFFALNTNSDGQNRSDNTVRGVNSHTTSKAEPISVLYSNNSVGAATYGNENISLISIGNELELYTATYVDVAADELYFYADDADATNKKQKLYAIYDKDKDGVFDENEDIIVEIDLANVGTSPEEWKGIGATALGTAYTVKAESAAGAGDGVTIGNDASKLTFYYNNDLEAGDTSAKLVDKVKLYEGITQKAYLAFDFDLNVHLESVQVTFDENGNEKDDAVKSGWAATGSPAVNTGATGTATNTGTEISFVEWTTP